MNKVLKEICEIYWNRQWSGERRRWRSGGGAAEEEERRWRRSGGDWLWWGFEAALRVFSTWFLFDLRSLSLSLSVKFRFDWKIEIGKGTMASSGLWLRRASHKPENWSRANWFALTMKIGKKKKTNKAHVNSPFGCGMRIENISYKGTSRQDSRGIK